MKYLLDSHILIWALTESEKLPGEAIRIINNPENEVFYSVASVWEIAIKRNKSPERIPISAEDLVDFCDESHIYPLPITTDHALMVNSLKRSENSPPHHDPFDRIMIAQAKYEKMQFLTHDSLLMDYNESSVIFI